MQYIPVKVIRNPFYDDHFDIKDERFLMGKTLYCLAKSCSLLPPELSRTLQLIGLGLYEKFELANQLLESWLQDRSCEIVVFQDAVSKILLFSIYVYCQHSVKQPKKEKRKNDLRRQVPTQYRSVHVYY